MRTERRERLATQVAAEVVGEHGTLTHRVKAALGVSLPLLRRAVTGGEHERVRRRAQVLVDRDESGGVAREAGFGEPGSRGGSRGEDDPVRSDAATVARDHRAGFNGDRLRVEVDRDRTFGEDALHAPADGRRMPRQEMRKVGQQSETRHRRAEPGGEAGLHCEQDLDAAGAAADDCERTDPAAACRGDRRIPRLQELIDRLHADRVLLRPRHRCRRDRADVERDCIERERGALCPMREPGIEVEADDAVLDQAGAGRGGEWAERDVRLVDVVKACDEAGQHSRVRRERCRGDQRRDHVGILRQCLPAQHFDVAVATPDQQHPRRGHGHYVTRTPSIMPPSSCSMLWQCSR